MNMNLECMNPIPILVLPTGSMQRKDGTAGRKVIFNAKGYNEETGVNTEFLDKNTGEVGTYFKIPCSKCIPCKMRKSREWITRGQMEATLYDSDDMCFLTLTYDDTHVPYTENGNMTLKHKDVQNFMDYLRKLIKRSGSDKKIRFLMSGEYGSKGERPHYHILLFGYNFFAKAKYVGESQTGQPIFSHEFINKAWQKGMANFGRVTGDSIAYTCKYAVKSLINDFNVLDRKKPYIQTSRKPGIGHDYIESHLQTLLRDKGIYLDGRFIPISSYMINVLLREGYMSEYDKVKLRDLKVEIAKLKVDQYNHSTDMQREEYVDRLVTIYVNNMKDKERRKISL